MNSKTKYHTVKILVSIIALLFISGLAYSQKKSKGEKLRTKGDEKYTDGEYFNALSLYKKAQKNTKNRRDKGEINFSIAECYRHMRNIKQAEAFYKRAVKANDKDPVSLFYHAQMLRALNNCDEAILEYNQYLKFVPGDKRATEGIESCELVNSWTLHPSRYIVEEANNFNTKYDDFCPVYDIRKDYKTIYITSNREGVTGGKKLSGITGTTYTDIFEVKMDRKGKWGDPEKLDTLINTEYDDGVVSLNEKSTEMYYTCCRREVKKRIGCQIYKVTKDGGEWGKSQIVPIVGDSISVGHPTLSKDEQTLYFSSRELGGEGGSDLFKVTRGSKGGSWGTPVNLGPTINSPNDELYPFIREDGFLYFSSDREPSMGGLDIYKATPGTDSTWTVENMRFPINSNADDFGIVFQGKDEKGLFSSSRKGGKGGVDIYTFVIPPLEFTIAGIVKDNDNEQFIPGVIVKLVGSDGTVFRDTSNTEDGKYFFKLKPKTDYIYIATKDGYFNSKGKVTTDSLEDSKNFTADILMSSVAKTIELPNIEYDFGKWELREASKTALDQLVSTLNDNPTLTIELLSHTDMIGTEEKNLEVSQKRAQSVVDYLISKGIDADRLFAKGYGKSKPKVISKELAEKYPFLTEGASLNEEYINTLSDDSQKEVCNQLNRRTEFKVLSTNYNPKGKKTTP